MTRASPMIVGNWKMNGLRAQLEEMARLADDLARSPTAVRVVLCPPATLIAAAADVLKGRGVELGAQDCHAEPKGAFTGDISAEMLSDSGARCVILGHSERRWGHGESSSLVADKVTAAVRASLEPIVCIGERLEDRQAGNAAQVVLDQLTKSLPAKIDGDRLHIAYEPVWAIGSGLTPTLQEISDVHVAIRQGLEHRLGDQGRGVRILYGGSVKPENAADILKTPEVGGALVGGASLAAADFLKIIRAI